MVAGDGGASHAKDGGWSVGPRARARGRRQEAGGRRREAGGRGPGVANSPRTAGWPNLAPKPGHASQVDGEIDQERATERSGRRLAHGRGLCESQRGQALGHGEHIVRVPAWSVECGVWSVGCGQCRAQLSGNRPVTPPQKSVTVGFARIPKSPAEGTPSRPPRDRLPISRTDRRID
jgi:hypothetical protein